MGWDLEMLVSTSHIPEALEHVVHLWVLKLLFRKLLGDGWVTKPSPNFS